MDELGTEIYRLLARNDEMGVSAIATALELPVATVHRYMSKQNTFIKTVHRKWRLPIVDRDWPLFGDETEPEKEVQSILDSPQQNTGKMLELIRYYESVMDIANRRVRFLKRLGQEVYRDR
jgi:hypothetical protein